MTTYGFARAAAITNRLGTAVAPRWRTTSSLLFPASLLSSSFRHCADAKTGGVGIMNRTRPRRERQRALVPFPAASAAISTSSARYNENSDNADGPSSSPAPSVAVGIFIDLDNASLRRQNGRGRGDGDEKHGERTTVATRLEVARKIRPLRTLATDRLHATSVRLAAYANRNTQTFKGGGDRATRKEEREVALLGQEYWEPMDVNEDSEEDLFPGAMVQTGYDEDGVLRCGVCGAKMRLTKKDRARGWTEYDKLTRQHMKLHDNEQRKRQNRLKSLKGPKRKERFLRGKEGQKLRKYGAAQVGLSRGPTNDWFRILKEEGVQRYSCKDVDTTLINAARQWLKKRRKRRYDNVVLVVVSEDSDFLPLLEEASAHSRNDGNGNSRFYAVTATWNSIEQTRSLVNASDVVVTLSENTPHAIQVWAANQWGTELLGEDATEDAPIIVPFED